MNDSGHFLVGTEVTLITKEAEMRRRLFDEDLKINSLGVTIGEAVCCALIEVLNLMEAEGVTVDIRDFHYVASTAASTVVSHVAIRERLKEDGFTEQMVSEAEHILESSDEEKVQRLAQALKDFTDGREEKIEATVIEFTKKGGK